MKTYPTIKLEQEYALRQFINQERGKLIQFLGCLINHSEAEDIFQESIFKVFQLAQNNPSKDLFFTKLTKLTPMLYAMAKNKAISQLRHGKVEEKYRNEVDSSQLDNKSNLESIIMKDSQAKLLIEAINHLPPICRQVFVQRKINGKSHAQIAAMLNITTKTIESHIANGLKQCRDYMRSHQANFLPSKKNNRKAG